MTEAIEAGIPKLRIEEAAARTQARIDSGRQPVIGVNMYRPDTIDDIEVLKVDNSAVRAQQLAKLERLRAERDQARLRRRPRPRSPPPPGPSPTAPRRRPRAEPARAVDRRRPRPRHRRRDQRRAGGGVRPPHGRRSVRSAGCTARRSARRRTSPRCGRWSSEFADGQGRRPRILVAKMGQDGHDRGQKVIATAFADLGFDVDVGPLFQTPDEVARQAVEADVHVVGVSTLAAGHLTLVPELKAALAELGPRRHPRRRRRRDPAAGLRRAARGRRGGDLPAGHGDRRRRGRAARRAAQGVVAAMAVAAHRPRRLRGRRARRRPHDARPGDHARRVDAAATTRSRPRSCSPGCCRTPAAPTASASPACPAPASRRSSTPSARELTASGNRVAVLAVDPSSSLHRRQHPRRQDAHDPPRGRRRGVHPAVADVRASSAAWPGRPARRSSSSRRPGSTSCSSRPSASASPRSTVANMVDTFLLLTLARTGDSLQGIKKGVLELADVIAVNKADGDHVRDGRGGGARSWPRALHLMAPTPRRLGHAGADVQRARGHRARRRCGTSSRAHRGAPRAHRALAEHRRTPGRAVDVGDDRRPPARPLPRQGPVRRRTPGRRCAPARSGGGGSATAARPRRRRTSDVAAGSTGAEAPAGAPMLRSGSAGRPAAIRRRRPSGRRCFELERNGLPFRSTSARWSLRRSTGDCPESISS